MSTSESPKVQLRDIAHARSGDKGSHANIGVIAEDAESFELLKRVLTANIVADYFSQLNISKAERLSLIHISEPTRPY